MLKLKEGINIIKDMLVLITLVRFSEMHRLFNASRSPGSLAQKVDIRLKILGGKTIQVRKGNISDRRVLKYVFYHKFHLPPIDLSHQCTILDLGANIGLTVLHLKHLYPDSRILAYEMDQDNFLLAQENCGDSENCTIVNQAVWVEEGNVGYDASGSEDAFHIVSKENGAQTADKIIKEATATSIPLIIDKYRIDKIDYLKMDIEGAETSIFNNSDLSWMEIVKCFNIEVHSEEFLHAGAEILTAQGYKCWKQRGPHAIIGVRK